MERRRRRHIDDPPASVLTMVDGVDSKDQGEIVWPDEQKEHGGPFSITRYIWSCLALVSLPLTSSSSFQSSVHHRARQSVSKFLGGYCCCCNTPQCSNCILPLVGVSPYQRSILAKVSSQMVGKMIVTVIIATNIVFSLVLSETTLWSWQATKVFTTTPSLQPSPPKPIAYSSQLAVIQSRPHSALRFHLPRSKLASPSPSTASQLVDASRTLNNTSPLASTTRTTDTTTDGADYGGLGINRWHCPIKQPEQHEQQSMNHQQEYPCFGREIDPNDTVRYENYRLHQEQDIENRQQHSPPLPHGFDNDDTYHYYDGKASCRHPSWSRHAHPTCLVVHELDLSRDDFSNHDDLNRKGINDDDDDDDDIYYITHGLYRDVWVVTRHVRHSIPIVQPLKEQLILKTTRYRWGFDQRQLGATRQEALVMERLTAYEHIISLYAYCGTSIITEAIPHEVEEYIVPGSGYRRVQDAYRRSENDYTPEEKLDLAQQMAESIAVLHGYEGGVIVHGDIQLQQWLRTADGRLKLGDFNRASILDWDARRNLYCKFSTGVAFGNNRSPEEYRAGELDEKIDVYSFGNIIYSLLTGLWVFYTMQDDSVVQEHILKGEQPYVDSRFRFSSNRAEQWLVRIMERCWEPNPVDRIDIFEVVRLLRAAANG